MTLNFRDIRTQLLAIVAVLVIVDIAAIVLLLSPAGRSRAARQQEYEQLRVARIEKAQTVAPAQGIDQKVTAAREQEASFSSNRLAQRYSEMSEKLSRIATEAGVTVSDVKYDEKVDKTAPPGYNNIGITMQVHGTYEQDIRFINAVERQKLLLLIDAVSFGGMQADELTVSVHLSTYMRSAA